jgi:hypothetical protein
MKPLYVQNIIQTRLANHAIEVDEKERIFRKASQAIDSAPVTV